MSSFPYLKLCIRNLLFYALQNVCKENDIYNKKQENLLDTRQRLHVKKDELNFLS